MSIHITLEDVEPFLLNGTVMTTLTNSGYLLYTLNMLKSLRLFGLDKQVLIVCIDRPGANALIKRGYHVICIDDIYGKFSPWNSTEYVKICYLKLELIYKILSLRKNVLLMDGDIVFRKNPMEDINLWLKDTIYDVWIQNDSLKNTNTTNMCTGYMFIKSSDRLITLYDVTSEVGRNKYLKCAFDNNDQTYFNLFVKQRCIFSALPLEKYPNGKMFYDNPNVEPVLVHFNWVHGHVKMAKMKEHKMWLLTPEEEV